MLKRISIALLFVAIGFALGFLSTPVKVITIPAPVEKPAFQPAQPFNFIASWYGEPFHGRLTASGAVFDRHAMTAAHRTLPFGTLLRLTYKTRSVVVEINDRGPYATFDGVTYFEGKRDLDVSEAVADALGFKERGVVSVLVERVQTTGD